MRYLKICCCYLLIVGLLSCGTKEVPQIEINASSQSLSRNNGLQFTDGKLFSGYVVKFNSNGTIGSRQGFLNGKTEGKAERFYENGQTQEIRYFSDNRKTGRHTGYYPDGSLQFEYHFKDDLPVNVHKEFYQNGQLFALSTYDDSGHPDGLQQQFFESGKIKANYRLKNGRRYGLLGAKGCMGENEKAATNFKP